MSEQVKKPKIEKEQPKKESIKEEESIFKEHVLLRDWIKAGVRLIDFIPKKQAKKIPKAFLTWKLGIRLANAALKEELKETKKITLDTLAKDALVKIMEGLKSSFL